MARAAQQCFGLSDEGIEDAIYDSQAICAFVGIDLNRESAPDATTLPKFRHLLEAKQLTRRIFDTMNAHLASVLSAERREKQGKFGSIGVAFDRNCIATAQ